jgi:hypothetical protein
MLRRFVFPLGRLALYAVLAVARVAYWPMQILSPRAAEEMVARVESWHGAFTRWCLSPRA